MPEVRADELKPGDRLCCEVEVVVPEGHGMVMVQVKLPNGARAVAVCDGDQRVIVRGP